MELLGWKEDTFGQRATNVVAQDIEDQAVERFRRLVERIYVDYHCRDARWLAWLAVHHRLTKLIHQNVKQDNRYCSGRMKRWVHP